jgi:PAS domain S-box-containing protein
MPTSELQETIAQDKMNRRIGGSLILFILSAILLLGVQGATLYDRFAQSSEVGLDNRVWVFAQLEVEAKNFSLALLEGMVSDHTKAIPHDEDAEIRSTFDIYYSRTRTAAAVANDAFVDLEALAKFQRLMETSQTMADLLDSKPTLTTADLINIYAAFKVDLPNIRRVASAALVDSVQTAESNRETRHLIVGQLQLLLGLVILLMVASVRQAMKVSRSVGHFAAETSKVAARLGRTLNASLDAVVLVDSDGRIAEHNAALHTILGAPTSETICGQEAIRYLSPEHRKAVLRLAAVLRANAPVATTEIGAAQRVNVNLLLANGRKIPVALSCAIDQSHEGRSTFIVFIRDRSQEVATANVLREARDQARLDVKAKERFLSVLSHEMRTPLHGVITSLELIRSNDLNADNQGFMQTATTCARSALSQIDDVLALTRYGYLGDADEPFVPVRLMDEIISEIMPLALERANRLTLEIAGNAQHDAILSKHRSFKLAVRNLLSNAVKYTSNGRIEVFLNARTEESGQVVVDVTIKDTGLGIDPADHARIFDEFAMVAERGADQKTGFGLGLAIAKSSVERLNGHIGLESLPGEGSTFHFTFEAPKAAASQTAPVAKDPPLELVNPLAKGKQVLVVDDNPVNRALMCEMLKRLGHSATVAPDGASAVNLAYKRTYDLILMDLSMPGMSGFEAARIIRTVSHNKTTRIIALTAHDLVECADELEAAGIVEAFQKPISLSQLQNVIAQDTPVFGAASARDDVPLLDNFQEVLGLLGRDMTRKLAETMLNDTTVATEALATALSSGAFGKNVGELAHRAGGAASVLGAARLGELWRAVEAALTAGDRTRLGSLAEDINETHQLTFGAIQKHAILELSPAPEHG